VDCVVSPQLICAVMHAVVKLVIMLLTSLSRVLWATGLTLESTQNLITVAKNVRTDSLAVTLQYSHSAWGTEGNDRCPMSVCAGLLEMCQHGISATRPYPTWRNYPYWPVPVTLYYPYPRVRVCPYFTCALELPDIMHDWLINVQRFNSTPQGAVN